MSEPSIESFLRDVAQHQTEIIRDEDMHRHARFRQAGTIVRNFDLITWPGHLCYTGDMGTYVFSRIRDMFVFFRNSEQKINPCYWGEKLLAIDKQCGFKQYDPDTFRQRIAEALDSAEASDEVRGEVECQVLSHADEEHDAMRAAYEFEHNGFRLQDFWEYDCTKYTFHYIWCCRAIVWGINQYDAAKSKEER